MATTAQTTMSDRPPIPDVTRGAGWDELLAARREGAELPQVFGRVLEVIAKSLWREWTLGRVVLPLSELERLRSALAEYEMCSAQQCEKGIHPDWAVDSEHSHTCPWCYINDLETQLARSALALLAGIPRSRHGGAGTDEVG